jgi:hypothetical protein
MHSTPITAAALKTLRQLNLIAANNFALMFRKPFGTTRFDYLMVNH